MKHVAAKIIEYVEAAAEMRVETRYIETIAGAAADNTTSSGNLGATREVDEGRLAARTVVKLDGDSVTTIPMRQAPAGEQELDTAILDQHQRNVSAAIEYRARMLDALIGLLRAGGRQV